MKLGRWMWLGKSGLTICGGVAAVQWLVLTWGAENWDFLSGYILNIVWFISLSPIFSQIGTNKWMQERMNAVGTKFWIFLWGINLPPNSTMHKWIGSEWPLVQLIQCRDAFWPDRFILSITAHYKVRFLSEFFPWSCNFGLSDLIGVPYRPIFQGGLSHLCRKNFLTAPCYATCKLLLLDSSHTVIISKNPWFWAQYLARQNEFCFFRLINAKIFILAWRSLDAEKRLFSHAVNKSFENI